MLDTVRHIGVPCGSRLPGGPGPGRHTTEPNPRSYHAGSPGRRPGELIPGYDGAGVMSGRPRAAYPEIVDPAPGIAARSTPELARAAAWRAWRALIRVLTGPEPAPAWRWRSPGERRAAYAALGLATLALCVLNAGTIHGVASMHASLTPPIMPPT